jgi:hypothetical protein
LNFDNGALLAKQLAFLVTFLAIEKSKSQVSVSAAKQPLKNKNNSYNNKYFPKKEPKKALSYDSNFNDPKHY